MVKDLVAAAAAGEGEGTGERTAAVEEDGCEVVRGDGEIGVAVIIEVGCGDTVGSVGGTGADGLADGEAAADVREDGECAIIVVGDDEIYQGILRQSNVTA